MPDPVLQTPPVEGPPVIPVVPAEKKTHKKLIVAGIILIVLLLVLGVTGYIMNERYQASLLPKITVDPTPTPPDSTACTQEAKLCPDGSYVGRTGPNCEFVACP